MPRRFRNRSAFTLIEMTAVLLLAGLTAMLATASFASLRNAARIDDAAERLILCDRLARRQAIERQSPVALVLDEEAAAAALDDISDGTSRRLCSLPDGFHMTRFLLSRDGEAFDRARVAIDSRGRSQTYAVQISGAGRYRWILFAGLSGQATRTDDDQRIQDIFGELAGGDDPH